MAALFPAAFCLLAARGGKTVIGSLAFLKNVTECITTAISWSF